MFEFVWDNPLGFLIAFIPALLNLSIVGYIIFKLPDNRLTNVFALLALSLALWQINDSITRISIDDQHVNRWDIILCAAWIFVGPLCLHFSLLYTSILKQNGSRTFLLLLYTPAIVFMLLYQVEAYPHEFIYDELWGWVNYHDKHWIDIVQIYWISALVISATALLFYHTHKIRKDELLKKQTMLIAFGIGIPTVAGIIGQVIMPIFLEQPAIPAASTFMTFFSLAAVISLNKYRLFNSSDEIANERLIDEMPLMIFMLSEKKRLTYMNFYASKVFGVDRTGVAMQPLTTVFKFGAANDHETFFNAYQVSMNKKVVTTFECGFITPMGKIITDISSKPIINNKQVVGVLFAARDITALKLSNEKIIHNEMLLADAQHIAKIGSWEWDLPNNTINWSDELYRIYGFEPGETKVTYESFLTWFHPEDKTMADSIIINALQSGEEFDYFARIHKKDNSIVNIYARGRVLKDENQNVVKMIGTAQDVTELIIKEDKLKTQNEELKKINHELDKFVYSVSHDLRAPLLSMLGVINITSEITNNEITLQHLGMLKSSVGRLDKFIEDILDYSRNSRGELKVQPVDFNQLLSDLTDDLKYLAADNHVNNISVDVNQSGFFYCDKSRLQIILSNLISNSIRYRNPLINDSYVKIRVDADECCAIITVEDNGVGISDKNQEKIFEMFYRVSESSTGSGLGLYLVKEAATKLQGKIEVTSQTGKGTIMKITVPGLLYQ